MSPSTHRRIGAASLIVCLPLLAQAQGRDTTRARLDTVMVTATREPRSLTQVPFAVSVLTADQWAGRSGLGMDQALQQVPGVFTQSRFGTHDIRLTIRGFGARGAGDRSNAGTSRGIRILLDGIPETEPDGRTAFDQIDLATIERMAWHFETLLEGIAQAPSTVVRTGRRGASQPGSVPAALALVTDGPALRWRQPTQRAASPSPSIHACERAAIGGRWRSCWMPWRCVQLTWMATFGMDFAATTACTSASSWKRLPNPPTSVGNRSMASGCMSAACAAASSAACGAAVGAQMRSRAMPWRVS